MPAEQIFDCTYIIKLIPNQVLPHLNNVNETEVTQEFLQQCLGPEHEVLSASAITDPTNPLVIHHVVKVKTPTPSEIANRLMGGESWVRKDQVLFTFR
eukprot:CAMPEP_0201690912 /NCGR_PEP_ID=MMETSP0578-20130828/4221_1 /ASSEMBLY_ACC=CAM_ASM_000663 /TAXON_ID=267565 /ORGANISM="Skeletonema grethea, Strain CCMP 1804" /LENGTH=97 /DNA_ID=CAMNT_0048176011 /DNA_START=115 /DNA_END=408 /DNA_ORIENTATION=-